MTEANIVKVSNEKVMRMKMVKAITAMKPVKVVSLSKVCAEMISASGEIGITEMMELCRYGLDGKKYRICGKKACWGRFSKKKRT